MGILPPLKRESDQVGIHATFEDGVASSLQGGVFGDVTFLNGPLEKQGRGSLHPHILMALLGHDLGRCAASCIAYKVGKWLMRVSDTHKNIPAYHPPG